MRVGLVTTWATECGIAEHSALLKQYVEAADPSIEIVPIAELDPAMLVDVNRFDVIHLNYHAALHSRWTPEQIYRLRQFGGVPVTVTYHDTGVPNSEQCKGVVGAATAAVVHEPFDDLSGNVYYWRMGVPDWSGGAYRFEDQRPLLGTVGFPFGWKNYDELCRITAKIGWALLLIAPNHTAADVMRWEAINPHVMVQGFLPRQTVVSHLSGCDATAFLYTCANTGQSGAVLQGIAARKPVIALSTCRQFRALFEDNLGRTAITWAETFADVAFMLSHFTRIERVSPQIVALAEQDSWATLGAKYAQLWRKLAQ